MINKKKKKFTWNYVTRKTELHFCLSMKNNQEKIICMLVADWRCCTAEDNTILRSNYPPIKNKFLKIIVI